MTFMTFENHEICRMDARSSRFILRLKNEIKPVVSAERLQEINKLTSSVLDSSLKVYSFLKSDDSDFSVFYEVSKEFEDGKRTEGIGYFRSLQEAGPFKSDYVKSGIHNTTCQLASNKELYGDEVASYLKGLSNSCTLFLKRYVAEQEHRINSTLKFEEFSAAAKERTPTRPHSLDSSGSESPEDRPPSTSVSEVTTANAAAQSLSGIKL